MLVVSTDATPPSTWQPYAGTFQTLSPSEQQATLPSSPRERPSTAPRPSPRPVGHLRPAATPKPRPKSITTKAAPAPALWRHDPEVSWYGPGFYGKRTACGLAYSTTILGVANRTLPCGTMVTFRYRGRVVRVPVIDRGPYVSGRQWDLSGGLCRALGHCFTGPIDWHLG